MTNRPPIAQGCHFLVDISLLTRKAENERCPQAYEVKLHNLIERVSSDV